MLAEHRGFPRQPALDGVRAVAVLLVLLFHQGWWSGGYVGVSVFFTLSGYLITSLALVEHGRTGRLDVRAFYGRRIRRLLPASLACLAGVVLLAVVGTFDDVDHLRRDLWGALGQVYNWVALGGGRSYGEMVGTEAGRSPLDHYWSLAIEEQFYWVWPLALVVILRRPARGRVVLVGAATLGFAVVGASISVIWGGDAAYWATPARLPEILAGALLAVVLGGRSARPLPQVVGVLAPAGLAVIVWASVAWPSASGPAYSGWLPVFALASVALIAGLQVPTRLRRVLASRPLVTLGAVSYGVYLFHWPVYVVLDEERTGLPTVPLFVLRLVVTLGLAGVSFRHLESPVRRVRPRRLVVPVGAATACLAVGVAAVLVPGAARPYWLTADAADVRPRAPVDTAPLLTQPPASSDPAPTVPAASTAAIDATDATDPTDPTDPTGSSEPSGGATTVPAATAPASSAPLTAAATVSSSPPPAPATTAPPPLATTSPVPVTPPLPAVAPSRPVRILVVGDSSAMATATGLEAFDDRHPELADVVSMAQAGCGFIPDGEQLADADGAFAGACRRVRDQVRRDLSWLQPDVVVGMVTITDLDQRTWDPAEGPLGPEDPRFHERLVAAYDTASNEFLAAGASDVLWLAPPVPAVDYPADMQHLRDPSRYARYTDALHEVAARHPGQVSVVDLAAWVAAQPAPIERPDGLHFSPAGATQIADALLGPTLVAAALS